MVGSYSFNNQTVRGEDYHQILNTSVRSEAQLFGLGSDSQQDGFIAHITGAVRSLLGETFLNLWIGKYGPAG